MDLTNIELKINIEYDGIYWHKLNLPTISLTDASRDAFLKENGWQVYRIKSLKNLNENELRNEFLKLQLK